MVCLNCDSACSHVSHPSLTNSSRFQLSHLEWDNLEIPKIAYQSTIFANGYFFQPGKQTHIKILHHRLQQVDKTPKFMDIFTCSRILIPVNIKLKHWILACIDFEQKWIAWLDSIGDTHEQETRLLFTWLTREHSLNRSSVFEPAEWSIHSGPLPNMQVPLQSNDFDCCIFI